MKYFSGIGIGIGIGIGMKLWIESTLFLSSNQFSINNNIQKYAIIKFVFFQISHI